MNIAALFIHRPIATTLAMVGILVFGIVGYRQLPVSDLPPIDYPTINVNASFSGASPETMASAVATPLERAFSTIPGIEQITSSSNQGSTNITLQFALSRNIDAAAQDVQTALSRAQRGLPDDMRDPPSYNKANPSDFPIIFYSVSSATLPLSTINEYAETVLAPRLSTIEGVAQVDVMGAQRYAVRVQVDPRALAYRRIGIDEVVTAVNTNNIATPAGALWGRHKVLALQSNGQLQSADAFRDIVVAYRNGSPVRLGDVGNVLNAVSNPRSGNWYNGARTIVVAVRRQPGSNTVRVADAVKARVAALQPQLPPAIDVSLRYDRSQTIRESVADVKFTLGLTLCLVVLVIFLFLRNIPATAIPSMALPMSVVGTFAVMALLGFSVDNLSMMALTLAVGFVVDDAIVMLENIHRHVEMGKPGFQAALDGSKEVGFTILSMTLSLVAVFIPLLFMPGLLGRLFHEFAAVIAAAILISGLVSLTLTPMMCSRFLKGEHQLRHGRFYNAIEGVWSRAVVLYRDTLHWVLGHRRTAMVGSLGILVATVGLFVIVPKGFIPSQDTGSVNGTIEAAEGTSWDQMVQHMSRVSEVVRQNPNVQGVQVSGGGGGPFGGGLTRARISVYLKPRDERRLNADQVIRGLQPSLSQIPGVRVFLSNPPAIRIGGRFSQSQYQFTLQSADLVELYEQSRVLETRMRELPSVRDVSSDLQLRNPQLRIDVDRDRAAALGLNISQVQSALYNAFGSRQISTILGTSNDYPVILELLPEFQRDPSAINLLHVRSRTGALVPLGAVATVTPILGPQSVNHSGQLPSVTLSFNLEEGVSLGEGVAAVQRVANEVLPSTITGSFSGTAQAFQQSQTGLAFLLVVAVLVIYLVLGVLYESFIHPLTILSALPFAVFGALLTLLIFRTDLNIYSYVGLILLVGLVKKNGIMMIDFALEAQRRERKGPAEAIAEACLIRFRPIMMTTMCALMATLPIAVGFGAGAEARQPLGIAVVGGLFVSQLVTLYVTPVIYTYLDEFQAWLGKRVTRRQPAAVTGEPALSGQGAD
ncbi:MAG: efflux RND transporter permease subunit [Gemmatimonadetes bacterium]|nr:efflux RND transporter permease subunit [Gemmatimonadota bacterium]